MGGGANSNLTPESELLQHIQYQRYNYTFTPFLINFKYLRNNANRQLLKLTSQNNSSGDFDNPELKNAINELVIPIDFLSKVDSRIEMLILRAFQPTLSQADFLLFWFVFSSLVAARERKEEKMNVEPKDANIARKKFNALFCSLRLGVFWCLFNLLFESFFVDCSFFSSFPLKRRNEKKEKKEPKKRRKSACTNSLRERFSNKPLNSRVDFETKTIDVVNSRSLNKNMCTSKSPLSLFCEVYLKSCWLPLIRFFKFKSKSKSKLKLNLNFNLKPAFSLVEILISLITISLILAAFAPVISKRATRNVTVQEATVACPQSWQMPVQIDGKYYCFTRYNVGDFVDGVGVDIPSISDVTLVNVSTSCTNQKCCWHGKTVNNCDSSYGNYSGCNRTVCTWYAASAICSSLGMTLPEYSQVVAVYTSYNDEAQLCCNNTGYNTTYCSNSNTFCPNGSTMTNCAPDGVWLNFTSGSYPPYFSLWSDTPAKGTHYHNRPYSVRCIMPLN